MKNTTAHFPQTRLRRLRQHAKIRDLIRETTLSINDLILPLFIRHGKNEKRAINSMPGQFQLSVDQLQTEIDEIVALGIPAVLLFGIPENKDAQGSDSYCDQGVVQTAIKEIKRLAPDLLVIADVCFCEYTDHGHCGVVVRQGEKWDVDNDQTLELLARQAVSFAESGADIIAPSGMMDGAVMAIRKALDEQHFQHIPILGYSAKYCSAFYGPFRTAVESAPQFGNRSTYQIDPANGAEAIREIALDVAEGVDMIIIKPAGAYLDIIYRAKQDFPGIPLTAYQVSGEYAMIKAAAQNGWIDEERIAYESLLAIKRAGADFIITYFAKDIARRLG
jgi:porphobilinogen synthase